MRKEVPRLADATFEKYIAGLSTGDLPDLVQLEDIALQQAIDTGSVLPAAGSSGGAVGSSQSPSWWLVSQRWPGPASRPAALEKPAAR